MKISKESRRKTGVGLHETEGPIGLLYQDPISREETIESIIKNRADSTKVLYNLFGTAESNEDISNDARKVATIVNFAIGSLKGKKENKIRNIYGRPERINNELTVDTLVGCLLNERDKQGYTLSKGNIDEALDSLVKRNFRNKTTKDALRILLVNTLVDEKTLTDEQKKEIQNHFVQKLVDDYNKTSIKNNTKKALENQNMVIQPSSNDKCLVIAETKRSNDKKTSEKDSFRMFLLDYASLDDDVRHDMRVKLRRLVDLYFYGKESVNKDDFDEWKDHAEKKNKNANYVVKVQITKKDEDGEDVKCLDIAETAYLIRQTNITCYRDSLLYVQENKDLFFEDDVLNRFWIHHIQSEVERIYKKLDDRTGDYKFQLGYLSEKVWKGIINYLSIKYIAEGKAVYQYCMNNLSNKDSNDYGVLDERYKDGITSFEYEKIKAEETLQRECAVSVSFAANHLANATVSLDKKNSDFLLIKKHVEENNKGEKKGLDVLKKPHTVKNILQFFGGASEWKDFDFSKYDELDVLYGFQQAIYSLRNTTFHFKTENIKDLEDENTELISAMFAHDCMKAGEVQKKKMYSNNVSDFYGQSDIKNVLELLYSDVHDRASQVPSFNKVFVRKNFPIYLTKHVANPDFQPDDMHKWQSAVYYLYKEIYYNAFLQDEESYVFLKKYVDCLPVDKRDNKRKLTQESSANANFKKAFNEYKKEAHSLSEICQLILTEYNNQNNGNRKANSSRTEKSFKHYKMILLKGLEAAFTKYIKQNQVYSFINNPSVKVVELSEEDFLPDYEIQQYNGIKKKFEDTQELQKWYIVARFLNPKQLNQLIGSFQSYEQYVKDVTRRAKQTGNPLVKSDSSIDVHNIIKVLRVCTNLNGQVSNNLEDYFESADEYAKYIAQFVDFGLKDGSDSASAELAAFCESKIDGTKIGIYHDGTNPIVNKNVILCKLYGASEVLSKSKIRKVDEKVINDYRKQEKEIAEYQKTGICKDKEQQMAVKKFQELKNRIELRNIVEYSEILNELQGQLINWSYLRERDLMYFQLGFHYLCLQKNGKDVDGYDKAGNYSGAILYQIVAMYTNGITMIKKDGKSCRNKNLSTGEKIKRVFEEDYSKSINIDDLYKIGLELFEVIDEHEQCIDLRNDIDHFHYFAEKNRSILDYYSEVFDRFFTYDMKYTKNVPNMIYNILLRHLVIARFKFEEGEKENKTTKPRASILIKQKGLDSEMFTYKLAEEKTVSLCARSTDFLSDVASLLYYPDDVPHDLCQNTYEKDKKATVKTPKKAGNSSNSNVKVKKENRKNCSGGKFGKR